MAETVNVSSSPGANYTWTSGKFAWSSATAGKNWTSAYQPSGEVVDWVHMALEREALANE